MQKNTIYTHITNYLYHYLVKPEYVPRLSYESWHCRRLDKSLTATVPGYQALFCAQDPNPAGSPVINHRPILVHQSESAPVSLSISPPFQSWRAFASQEMMRVSLRNYSRGLITQWERADSDETSVEGSDEGVSLSLLLSLFPWFCDKLHQLLLLDLKMPLKGVMDSRDQWEPRWYFVAEGAHTS